MKQKSILTLVLAIFLATTLTTCQMEINEIEYPPLFVEPFITAQPASKSYYPGEYTASTPLVVEHDGWLDEDGTLSYQWYTFTDLAAYVKAGGIGTPIDGATTATYTPPALTTTPGARYYYYVELTNESGAVDKQSSTVRSNTAIISFNSAGAPAIPLLVQQPVDGAARFAASLNPLLVRPAVSALPADTGDFFYQWYQVGDDLTKFVVDPLTPKLEGAEKLDGEEGAWFSPDTSKLALGDHFFFVVVEHAIGRVYNPDGTLNTQGTSSYEASVPVKVSILPGLNAATPVITIQPKSGLYFAGQTIAALSVEAESPDNPDLKYQWYSNNRLATTTGEPKAIDNATGKTYTPADSGFYFVEVINEHDNVVAGGNKRATVTSHAVNVRRQTGTLPATIHSQLTLRPDIEYQYVRGYGGMEVAWANFPETFPEDTELMYNPDRLGYNILRIMLPLFNVNIDLSMDQMIRERRKHYYDNVKIVNKYGGYVAAAPWSPPKEWKSNNSINGGGKLQHEYYRQYAAYLKAFSQHMYNRGAPIYCISIQNEPNYTAGYDGCEWTPNEMRDFFVQVGTFTEGVRGYGGGSFTPRVLTMNGESANNPSINWAAIDEEKAYRHIDVFARHIYGERRKNLWGSAPEWPADYARPHVQQVDGKEIWMTEHNINSANATAYPNDSTWNYIWRFMNDIDLVMRLNNENAFVWWASKRFYSMVGDGQFTTVAGEPLARGWGLSHYSKYTIDTTRIGFDLTGTTGTGTNINYRKQADNRDLDENAVVNGAAGDMDNVTARISAYISQDGKELSVVMWTPTTTGGASGINMGTIEINMPAGFTIGSAVGVQSYKKTENENAYHEDYEVLVNNDRDKAYVTLPESRIISVKFTKE